MLRSLCVLFLLAASMAGCAKPPPSSVALASYTDGLVTGAIAAPAQAAAPQPMPPVAGGTLAGRTLTVSSNAQLVLRPGEVVLTFDDGPHASRTEAVLDTLDAFGVKATFLMLGEAAERHPALVRAVAQRGHTIGTHTFAHANLTALSGGAALDEMAAGHSAVARALVATGTSPSRFFRFPYLAHSALLRASATDSDFIILDVDIDSKDYYPSTPREVMSRTLDRLEKKGQGIVLFHDIHARTVTMLPEFLTQLQARGYKVVTLRSTGGNAFETDLVTAAASVSGS